MNTQRSEQLKRVLDVLGSSTAIIATAPILAIAAVTIRLTEGPPVLFRQERVGQYGKPFTILKFRTMTSAPDGAKISSDRDGRITPVGRLLRRWKIDEAPQFFNVVRGDMSLVGPRPEIPHFVNLWDADKRTQILDYRPGITDPTAIAMRNESEILARVENPEQYYINVLLPQKVNGYHKYVISQSTLGDLRILLDTAVAVARPKMQRSAADYPEIPPGPANGPAGEPITFRELEASDAPRAAEVHHASFPHFFLSTLGKPFLRSLYYAFAKDPNTVTVAALRGETLIGIAAGPLHSASYLKKLAKRHSMRFTLGAMPAFLRNPLTILQVATRLRAGNEPPMPANSLLSSICVDVTAQGSGVGQMLLDQWWQRTVERGSSGAYLTTDADSNDRTIRFYQQAGWTKHSSYTTPEGRNMIVMHRELR